jgi:uncharacterized membrane protein YccF (DUF307 family)
VTVQNTITVQQAAPTVVVVNNRSGPNILLRLLWFIFLGLWLGAIVTFVAYFFCITIIGLPVGLAIFNQLPAIMTLRPASNNVRVSVSGNATAVTIGTPQLPFLLRTVYFLLVGWWLAALWISVAWLLTAIWLPTVGLSLAPAFLMFDRIPVVMTLRRN